MANFSKSQMFAELRLILLCIAQTISFTGDRARAEAFIGLSDVGERFTQVPITEVVLENFAIAGYLDSAYDYAFQPDHENDVSLGLLELLMDFVTVMPQFTRIRDWGSNTGILSSGGMCRSVVMICRARWALDVQERAYEFTIEEIAGLANMSEGAVRNAIADKSKDGLRAKVGRKPIIIAFDEARRWLQKRRGFFHGSAEPRSRIGDELANVRTYAEFSAWLRVNIASIEVQDAIGLRELIEEWLSLPFVYDEELARYFATALKLDVPSFLGKAFEVSLR